MEHIHYEQSMSDVIIYNQHSILPHLHRHIELKFVYTGTMEMMLDGHRKLLNAGDAVIVFPFQIHSYFENPDARVARILLSSDRIKSFSSVLREFIPIDGVFDCEKLGHEISVLSQMIRDVLEAKTPCSSDIATNLFIAVCGMIIERLPMKKLDRSSDMSLKTFDKIIDWCNLHFCEPMRLSRLADALFISERQLSRIFSEQIHIGFRTYINSLRVQRAFDLLLYSNKPITEIALECGFESISSFNRVFRETMKCSPRELRARLSVPDAETCEGRTAIR